MLKITRWLFSLVLLAFSFSESVSQDFCPQVSGQGNFVPISESCLPSARKVWRIEFSFNDVVTSDPFWDPNDVAMRINWGDGSAVTNYTLTSGAAEVLNFTTDTSIPGIITFILLIEHFYTVAAADCFYEARAQLFAPGVCIGIVETREFEVWGTDEENGAALAMNPSVPDAEVCVGTDFNITFDDTSTWNCIDPTLALPNDETRWVRFVYGDVATGNANRIPNVFVGGVQVTNADGSFTSGTPLFGPVVEITGPGLLGPTETSQVISMLTADEVVGDIFNVTLQNWNVCNQYDDGLGGAPPFNGDNPPITINQNITIIGPVDPLTTDNEYCEGDARPALTVTNFPGAPTTVSWYNNATGGTPIGFGISFTPPSDGTFFAEFSDGCISKNRTAATLTENPLPNDIGLVVNRSNICFNDNVVVSIIGSENGVNYQLRNDAGNVPIGGVVAGNGFNRTLFSGALTTTTTFNVLATNVTTNCDRELSDLETVNVNPDITTVNASVADATVCIGDDINLNATVVGGSGSYTFSWTGPNGFTSTLQNPTISGASALAAGNYSYTVTDAGFTPTVGTCDDVSNTVAVTMLTPPSLADLSGDNTICQGASSTLLVAITGGTGPFDVTIDNGVGTFSWNGAGDNPSVSPATTTTYTITSVVDANGCNVGSITGSATITIGNPTDADLDGDASICPGDNTDLTVVITGGTGPFTLNITNLGIVNSYNSGDPINTGALAASTTYTLTSVQDANGCFVTGISDNTATVSVGAALGAVTLNVADVCDGDDRIFSVDIVGGAPNFDLSYTVNAGPVQNDPAYVSGASINLGPGTASTNYNIVITALTDACGSTPAGLPAPDDIFVNPLPAANDQTPIVCSDAALGNTATVDLTALEAAIDGGAGNTINWFENNGPLSNPIGTPASYLVTDATPIFAEVDDGTCTDVATITYTVNQRPNPPTGATDAISCSAVDPINPVFVDDPGPGFTIRWFTAFTDPDNNTPVAGIDGTISGTNSEIFTPSSSATATFFAAIEDDGTNCLSPTAVTLTHTEDERPADAAAGTDIDTCEDNVTLAATDPSVLTPGSFGLWSIENVAYYENFNSPADDLVGALGPVTAGTNNGVTAPLSQKWTVDVSGTETDPAVGDVPALDNTNDLARVQNNRFEFRDVDGESLWKSEIFDISTFTSVDLSVDLSSSGLDNGSDFVEVYFKLNGGAATLFTTNGALNGGGGDFSATASENGLSGTTLQIIIIADNTANNDFIFIDNVLAIESGTNPPSIEDHYDASSGVTNLSEGTSTTFTWNVQSQLGICNVPSDDVIVTRNPLPVANDLSPEFCANTASAVTYDVTAADLTNFDDLVTGIAGSVDRTVEYFETSAYAVPIVTPYTVDNSTVTQIFVRVTNTDPLVTPNCESLSTITFTVNPLPAVVDQNDANNALETVFCEETVGGGIKDDVVLSNLDDDVASGITLNRSVEWFFDPGGVVSSRADLTGNEILTPGDVDNVSDGDVFYAIVVDDLTLCEDIAQVEITVNPRPVNNSIIAPDGSTPASVTVCRSSNVLFFQIDPTLTAGTTYNWTVPTGVGELELVGGGGVNDFFVLVRAPNTIVSPGVTLSVVEVSVDGCPSNSNDIDIIVDDAPPAPTITGDQDVCDNQSNVTYSIASPIVGSTYTWDIGTLGSIVTGQGTSSIIVNIGTTSDNITVVETSSAGCTSPPATAYPVTVNPRPNITSLDNATVCSGVSIDTELTFTADVGGTNFDWVVQSKSVFVGGTVVGNTGSGNINEVPTNFSNTFGTVVYEVTPSTNPAVGVNCDGPIQTVTISVEPVPVANAVTTTPTVCNGDNIDVDITTPTSSTNPADLTFDYTVSSTNAGVTGGTAFSGAVGQTYPLNINGTLTNSSDANVTVTYTVTPLLAGCANGSDVTVDVIVEPTPSVAAVNNATTICNGDSPDIDVSSLTVPSIPGDLTFDVVVSSSDAPSTGGTAFADQLGVSAPFDIDATDGILTNSSDADLTVTYTITPRLAGCADGTPITVDVIVEPTPSVAAVNNATTICNGDSPDIDVSSLTVPSIPGDLTFDVVVSSSDAPSTGGTAFVDQLGLTTPFDIDATDGILTNSSDADLTVTYTITPRLAGCTDGTPITVDVIVEPTPSVAAVNNATTICNGDSPDIDVSSLTVPSIPGDLTFDVVVSSSDAPSTGGTAFVDQLGLTTPFDIDATDGILTNSSDADLTVTYTITPRLAGCADGTPITVDVIVEPTPSVAAVNNATTICNGDSPDIDVSSLTVPSIPGDLTFDVVVSSSDAPSTGGTAFVDQLGLTTPFDIDATDGILTNSSDADLTVTYTITPRLAGCADGTPITVDVIVEPTPSVAAVNNATTICNGDSPDIDVSSLTVPSIPGDLTFDVVVSSSDAPSTGGTAFVDQLGVSAPFDIDATDGILTNSSDADLTVTYTITPRLAGCADGTPITVDVIVEPTPSVITTNNAPTICNGGNVDIDLSSLTVPSIPGNLTFDYSVSSSDAGSTAGTAFSGGAALSFPFTIAGTLTNSSDADLTVTYTITPRLAGCADGTPITVDVIVEPTPSVAAVNNATTICNGDSPDIDVSSLTVPSIPGDLTFDVVVSSSDAPSTGGTAFADQLGVSAPFDIDATDGILTNSSDADLTVTYTITPRLAGCADGTPITVDVIVEPTPSVAAVNNATTICNGDSPDIDVSSLTVPSVPGDLTFDVVVSSSDAPSTGGTAFADQLGLTTPFDIDATDGILTNSSDADLTVTYTITPRLAGCADGTPVTVDVIVEPTPSVAAVNNATTICNGDSPDIDVSSLTVPSVPGDLTFDVVVSSSDAPSTGGTAFVDQLGVSAPFDIDATDGILTNSSDADLTVTYTITPRLAGCADGTPITVDVIVEPTPSVAAVNNATTICNGDSPDIDVSSLTVPSIPGDLTFDVVVSSSDAPSTGGTAFADQLGVSAPFDIDATDGILTNSSDADLTVTYTITPRLAGCTDGTPITVDVIVEPTPSVAAVNNATTICNGDSPDIDVSSLTVPSIPGDLTFDVVVSSSDAPSTGGTAFVDQLGLTTPFDIDATDGILTNSSDADLTVTYTITPRLAGCADGTPITVDVIVEPTPSVAAVNNATTICNGDSPDIDVSSLTVPSIPGDLTFDVVVSSSDAPSTGGTAFADQLGLTTPFDIDATDGILTNSSDADLTVTYTITPRLAGCADGTPITVDVIVEPTPSVAAVNNATTICNGDSPDIDVSSLTVPSIPGDLTFDVVVSSSDAPSTGGTAFADQLGVSAPFDIDATDGILTNSSDADLTVTYTITPRLAGCADGTPITVDVIVEPTPSVAAVNNATTICNGDSPDIDVSSLTVPSIPGDLTFDVVVSSSDAPSTGGTAFADQLGVSAPFDIDATDGILTNSSDADLTVTYTITPRLAGCTDGTPITVDVIVEPTPSVAAVNNATTICNGDSPDIDVSSLTVPSIPGDLTFDVVVSSSDAPSTGGTAFADQLGLTTPFDIDATDGILTNGSDADLTVTYTITPRLAGCADGTPITVDVIVEPTPSVITTNNAPTICNGGNVDIDLSSLTVPSIPGNLTFDYSVSSSDAGSTAGTAFSGGAALSFPFTIAGTLTNSSDADLTVTYTITPRLAGCADGTPITVDVIVEPTPSVAAVNNATTICNGDSPDIDVSSLTVPSIPGDLTFDVVVSSSDAPSTGGTAFVDQLGVSAPFDIDATDGILTNSSDADLTVTYTITPRLAGCADGTPITVDVIVEPTPSVITTNNAPTICNGGAPNIDVRSLTVPSIPGDLTFDVVVSSSDAPSTGGTAFADQLGLTTPFDIDAIDGILTNSSDADLTVTYTITPRLAGCADGTPVTVDVIVEPTPSVAAVNNATTICNGDSPDIDVSSLTVPSVPGDLTFDVVVSSSDAPSTGGSAFLNQFGVPAPFDIDATDGILTNSSDADLTVTYTITPRLAGCANGTPITVDVIVEPTPSVAAVNNATTICNGDSPDIDVSSLTVPSIPGNLTFDVTVSSTDVGNTGGPAFANQLGLSAPFDIDAVDGVLTNSSNDDITVTYTITPRLAGCADGTPLLVNVVVEPTPVLSLVNNTPLICDAGAVDIDVLTPSASSNPGDLTYDVNVSSSDPANTGGTAFVNSVDETFIGNIAGSLTNSSDADITVTFTVTPKLLGCANGADQIATIVVEPTPNASIVLNTDPTICNGDNVNIGISSTTVPSIPANLFYDVTVTSTDDPATGGTAYVNNPGQAFPGSIIGTLTNSSDANLTVTFTVTPRLSGCADGTPQTIDVVVEPTPQVVLSNTTPDICGGDNVSIDISSPTVSSVPGDLTFDVVVSSTDFASTGGSAFVNLTDVSAPLTINGILTNSSPLGNDVTVTFDVTPKINGCAVGPVQTENVIVRFVPIISTTLDKEICSGEFTELEILLQPTNSPAGTILNWSAPVMSDGSIQGSGGTNVAADPAGTLHINDQLVNTSSASITATYTVTPTSGACVGTPQDIIVTVRPEPVVDPALAGPFNVCSDDAVGITLGTNGISVNAAFYTIAVNPNGLTQSAGTNSAGTSKFANEIVDDAWTNTSNVPVSVFYTVTPFSSLNCEGQPFNIEISILPEPVFDSSINPAPACSDLPIAVTFDVEPFSVAADSYLVSNVDEDAGLTPTSAGSVTINGASGGDNLIFNDSWTNITGSPLDVRYTVRPITAGCEGDDFVLTVTINSAPEVTNPDFIVCSGDDFDITFITTSVTVQYDLVVVPDPSTDLTAVNVTPDGSYATSSAVVANQFTNTGDVPLTVEYRVIPTGPAPSSCSGPQQVITVTVEPEPTVSITNDVNICSGDDTAITLNSTVVPTAGVISYDIQALSLGAVNPPPAFIRTGLVSGTTITDNLVNIGTTVAEVQYTITPQLAGANNGSGCPGTPVTVSVFVEPEPIGSFTQSFVTVCEGQTFFDLDPDPMVLNVLETSIVPSGTGTVEFELTNVIVSDPVNVTGYSTSGIFQVGDPITDVIDIADLTSPNTITTPQTVTYQLTPRIVGSDAGTCMGNANSVELVVTVLPRPTVAPSVTNLTVCSGEPFQIDLPTDVTNSFARWTVSSNDNIEGEIGNPGGSTSIFTTLINTSDIPQSVTYTIEPFLLFDTGCTGPTVDVVITVDPNPDVVVDEAVITVCSGEPVNIELNGNVPNTIFNWAATLPNGTPISGSGTNGDLITDVIVNTSGVPEFVEFVINGEFGVNNCAAIPPGRVFVTVNPMVDGQILTDDQILCTGNSQAIEFEFIGAPPFSIDLQRTQNGVTELVPADETSNLPGTFLLLATEDVQYTLLNVRDNNGCEPVGFVQDEVTITFEEAIADFEVRWEDPEGINSFGFTTDPDPVLLDFNTGRATVEFRFNNFDPANTYTLQIGDTVIMDDDITPIMQYTFTEPSVFNTFGFNVELQVGTPSDAADVIICNDVANFFIQVIPADPVVIGCIGEGCNTVRNNDGSVISSPEDLANLNAEFREIAACPPFTLDFYSYVEDDDQNLLLSRNVNPETLTWTINGQTIQTPNPSFTFTQPGTYDIEVKGDNGFDEVAFDNLIVTAFPVPTAEFSITQIDPATQTPTVFIPDDGFRPINRSSGATSFLWDFGDFNVSMERSPEHFYELEGDYRVLLTATNDFGCVDTVSSVIRAEEGGFTKTPNAFTPGLNGPSGGAEIDPNNPASGDAVNDIFLPITTGVEEFEMYIFDRWGNLIFYSDNQRVGWDGYDANGDLLPAGVYVYKLDLVLSSGQRTTRVGDVTLIR